MKHINDLSDDCLCLIFSRLSLSCKLTLHRICRRWRSLQYSVTCIHKSLTLLIGTGSGSRALLDNSRLKVPYLDQIEPHNSPFNERTTILELSKLSPNVVSQLKKLLPKVTSLEVCLNQRSVSYVLDLLRFWSSKLKHLSLYYTDIGTHRSRGPNGLLSHFELINQHCLALDTLSIELGGNVKLQIEQENINRRGRPVGPIPRQQLDLPCLARLAEFRFYSHDSIYVLFDSLENYATNDGSLKRIAIANSPAFDQDFNFFFPAVPQIKSKFTILPSIQSPSEFAMYTALTTVSITLASWTRFTAYLLPLKSLVHVHVRVVTNDLSQYDTTPSYVLAQLPSIRIIQIEVRAKTYRELQSRHWGWIFPSLELLEVKLDNQGEALSGRGNQDQKVRGARLSLLLEPFKWQCPKLRRIVTLDKYEDEDKAEKKVWELVGANTWNEVVNE